jgi:DNA repair exonuclease SbcCD ATPase subunit
MTALHQKQSEDRLKTISDKVKAHEMQLGIVNELYKVIVTGDIAKGEPGMLENNRNTTKALLETSQALERIENKLSSYAELDRRVREIEERHAKVDKEIDFKKKELSNYKYYFITLGISNFVTILWLWIKP